MDNHEKENVFESLHKVYCLKNYKEYGNFYVKDIREITENKKIHQFSDKFSWQLLLDTVINQLAYNYHYNTEKILRYKYCAKNTDMFLDILILDECRYIYEWMPTVDFLRHAMDDLSWQYIYRILIDGIIKHRLNYNNEYFYAGSIISKNDDEFGEKILKRREEIV